MDQACDAAYSAAQGPPRMSRWADRYDDLQCKMQELGPQPYLWPSPRIGLQTWSGQHAYLNVYICFVFRACIDRRRADFTKVELEVVRGLPQTATLAHCVAPVTSAKRFRKV